MKLLSIVCLTLVGFLTTVNCCKYGENGLVYIIQMGYTSYYKVGGTTQTINNRIRDLQTGNPMQLRLRYKRKVTNCLVSETKAQNAAATVEGTQRIRLKKRFAIINKIRYYDTEWFRVSNYATFEEAVINALNGINQNKKKTC